MSRNYVKGGRKTCPRCDVNKPVEDFGLRSSGAVHSWCSSCNTGLGMFKDNPDFLIEAAKYVQRHKEVQSVAGVTINKEP